MNTTGLLVIRVVAGIVMTAHGLQKIMATTVAGVQGMLEGLGLPLAAVLAPVLSYGEVVVGALLILGLLTRAAGLATAAISLGALFLVHLPAGFFVADGGIEFVLLLAAVGLGLALTGAGRASVDGAVKGRRTRVAPAEPAGVA